MLGKGLKSRNCPHAHVRVTKYIKHESVRKVGKDKVVISFLPRHIKQIEAESVNYLLYIKGR